MAYQRNRSYNLEKERDLSLTIAPEGTPLPDRVCGGCAHYRAGGSCAERRKDVGYLWTACAQFTTETPKPQDTMEKTTPTTKVCKKCGRELPAEAFNRHAKSRDGLQPYCRECQREFALTGAVKAGRPKKDKPVTAPAPTIPNPSVTEIPDHDLAQELRRRGYDVTCKKTIEL